MYARRHQHSGESEKMPNPEIKRYKYSWLRDDFETKLGFKGGRYTEISNLLCIVVALLITVLFYAALIPFSDRYFAQIFTQRGPVQYVTVYFSCWAFLIVLAKMKKTNVQRKALEFGDLVPPRADFVLSRATVDDVLGRLRDACEDPRHFFLFNRIELALSNLKNMGQIGDVDGVLQSQAANDEDIMESSYSLVRGLIWAIPVLGFIGTVQGLGMAMGSFGGVLTSKGEISQLKDALLGVTKGLATAFETTFVALVAALANQLFLVMVRKREEELLDDCKNYCQRNIVGRLRMEPF